MSLTCVRNAPKHFNFIFQTNLGHAAFHNVVKALTLYQENTYLNILASLHRKVATSLLVCSSIPSSIPTGTYIPSTHKNHTWLTWGKHTPTLLAAAHTILLIPLHEKFYAQMVLTVPSFVLLPHYVEIKWLLYQVTIVDLILIVICELYTSDVLLHKWQVSHCSQVIQNIK